MQKTNYYKSVLRGFPFDGIFVGRFYDRALQKKLKRFKFVHNTVDTVYFESIFRDLIAESGIGNNGQSVITYPPISLKDRIFRGPNHAKKLAKIFARISGIPMIACPFHKNFFAGHQSQRSKSDRKHILGEYCLKKKTLDILKNKDIIIVDDIITTGYTMKALGNLLQPLGVNSMVGFFLASQKI